MTFSLELNILFSNLIMKTLPRNNERHINLYHFYKDEIMVVAVESERSLRIEKLKEAIRPEKYPLCLERDRFYTMGYKESEEQNDSRRDNNAGGV